MCQKEVQSVRPQFAAYLDFSNKCLGKHGPRPDYSVSDISFDKFTSLRVSASGSSYATDDTWESIPVALAWPHVAAANSSDTELLEREDSTASSYRRFIARLEAEADNTDETRVWQKRLKRME